MPIRAIRSTRLIPCRLVVPATLLAALLALTAILPSTARATAGVYRVPIAARELLLSLGAPVDHARIDGEFVVELTDDQVRTLRSGGYEPTMLFSSAGAMDEALRSRDDFRAFNTYEQIRDGMYACASAHPDIARLVVLGTSLEGRELLGLKISDQPQAEENEPGVVFWGGIHGNEYAGGEMPYLYALYLCDNYGLDTDVTRRVNDNEIWCIPMINPDGRAHGVRGNHNGIDLNRDFGFQWNGESGTSAPLSQVETQVVREFCRTHDITLSLTFHCSGDIVFYPWGYSPQNTPDGTLIHELSSGYATLAAYGHGNSWADYETHGELIDDLYGTRGGFCATVEINNTASLVAQTFERNRVGMNWLTDQAVRGIAVTVSDAVTGAALEAELRLAGSTVPSYSDPAGHTHRVLPAGTYTLTVQANGYQPATVPGIVVVEGSVTLLAIPLIPGGGEYAFRVAAVNQRDPNNAHSQATVPADAVGPPDGLACSLGSSGFIVLDLGEGHEVVDGAGADFVVTEALWAADPAPEAYRVYAGDAYVQTVLIGSATGTASFDLSGSGVASTRYLKIVDLSGASPNLPYAGMDLDAVTVLHGGATSVDPPVLASKSRLWCLPNPSRVGGDVQILARHGGGGVTLPSAGEISSLGIFDAAGRLQRRLERRGDRSVWDGRDGRGRLVPAGVYWVQLHEERSNGEASSVPEPVRLVRVR